MLFAGVRVAGGRGDARLVRDRAGGLRRDLDRGRWRWRRWRCVPSAQVTVPADCEQVPCEGVAELNVTPAGSVSVTAHAGGAGRARVADAERVGQLLALQHRVGRVRLGQRQVRRPGSRSWRRSRVLLAELGSADARRGARRVGDRPGGLRRDLDLDAGAGAVRDGPERAGDRAGRLRAAALRRRGRVERDAGRQRVADATRSVALGRPGVLDADACR